MLRDNTECLQQAGLRGLRWKTDGFGSRDHVMAETSAISKACDHGRRVAETSIRHQAASRGVGEGGFLARKQGGR